MCLGLLIVLFGFIAVLFGLRHYRFDILANHDLEKFAQSSSSELYVSYPHLIDKIVEIPELSRRVVVVHLGVSDFRSAEFKGRNFSSLARLPNLKTVECTYSHNVDALVPTLNQIETLVEVRLYYCDPIGQAIQEFNSETMRSIEIHTSNTINIRAAIANAFAQRMPGCMITFSSD